MKDQTSAQLKLRELGIALLAIVAIIGILLLGLWGFVYILSSMSSDIGKAIVTALVTIPLTIITIYCTKLFESQIKISQDLRERKIAVYETQIHTLFEAIFAKKYNPEYVFDENKLGLAFISFTEKLLIWGGSEVIQEWSAFREHDWKSTSSREAMGKLEKFLLAVRSELGNNNSKLDNGRLLTLFITDLNEKAIS